MRSFAGASFGDTQDTSNDTERSEVQDQFAHTTYVRSSSISCALIEGGMMDRKEIEEKVKTILADVLDVDKNKITISSLLVDDLGADSFNAVEILFAIKEKFKVEIPQAELAKARAVEDIVTYIEKRLRK